MNIRLAGFGGQGIVMAGYVLGHAGILDGRNALQTQSYDRDLVKPGNAGIRAFGLPATDIAHKTLGRNVVANAIMLGCLSGVTVVVSPEALRKAIAESVLPKTVDVNLAAFEEGLKRGAEGDGT